MISTSGVISSIKHLIQLPVVNFINAYHFGYVERYCFTITVEYLYKYVSIATVKSNFIAKDGTGTMILLFFFLFYFVYGSSSSFKTLPKTIQGYFLLCLSNRFIFFLRALISSYNFSVYSIRLN